MSFIWLILASFVGWFVSTLAGGGVPLILIPAIGYCLGAAAVAPVLTIGMLFGHPQRVFLYWGEIDWQITGWYVPGAVIGASLGAFVFTQIQLQWLPIILGLVLLLSTFSYGLSEKNQLFQVRPWYFLPAALIHAFLSGITGSTGPLLNPLYLNYGLDKEQMIGTKAVHMSFVHGIKLITYAILGACTLSYWGYGVLIGLAALPGNWVGQMALKKLTQQQFRQFVIAFVALSGFLILGKEIVAWAGHS